MIFAVFGGDDRSLRLIRLLRGDGHTVRHFGLERMLAGGETSAAAAAEGADCVILPLPAEKDGYLNAPYAAEMLAADEALRAVRPGTPVCAGKAGSAVKNACAQFSLPLHDYFLLESFTQRNAALTAQGTLALMAQRHTLLGSRVLVSGFGRIGKRLAKLLTAAGAQITVAARSEKARAEAAALGCRIVPIESAAARGYEFVVNTVPSVIFGAAEIAAFGNAVLIELASPPYGFDLAAAKAAGREVTVASGLPGKYAPEAAAAAVKDAIYEILEE